MHKTHTALVAAAKLSDMPGEEMRGRKRHSVFDVEQQAHRDHSHGRMTFVNPMFDGSEDEGDSRTRLEALATHQFASMRHQRHRQSRKHFASSSLPPLESGGERLAEGERRLSQPEQKELPVISNARDGSTGSQRLLHNMIYRKLKAKTDKRKARIIGSNSVPSIN